MLETWRRMSFAQRRDAGLLALLVLVVCMLFGLGHGRYGLFDVDEGIFTQATIEMRHSDELAMPTYNGEPRYHKPPMIYWLQDAAMGVLGEHSLYAARLPSAISAILTVLLLGAWLWGFTGDRKWALASMAMMGLNLSFLVVGRAATADGILNLASLALALWLLHVCFPRPLVLPPEGNGFSVVKMGERMRKVQQQATYWRWQWVATGVLGALGFLAKGPIAWLPGMIVVGTLLLARKDKAALWQRVAPVRAGLLALALLVPWVWLLLAQHGIGFFYEFIVVQNLGRYAGGLSNTQSSSHFYYLLILLFGFFPWVLVLPSAVAQVTRGKVRTFKTALANRDLAKALPALSLVWAAVYIVFFSFSQTKLAHYIVPAYPALAILGGWFLTRVPQKRIPHWIAAAGVLVALLMAALMLVLNSVLVGARAPVLTGWLGWLQAMFNFQWPLKDLAARAVLAEPVHLSAIPYWIAAVLVLVVIPAWLMVARARKDGAVLLGMGWALVLAMIVCGIVPEVWNYTQAPLARLAGLIAEAPASTPVVHLGLHKPSVLYLSGRRFTKLDKPLQLPDNISAPETLVLTKEAIVPGIVNELNIKGGSKILSSRCDGGFCLLVVAPLGGGGAAAVDTLPGLTR